MRYLVLAGLMFALGLVVVSLDAQEHRFVPVVRMRTGDGFFITVVQDRTMDRKQCFATAERFIRPLGRTCPECVVESVDCDGSLHGIEQALDSGAEIPLYTVSGAGLRMALVGPPGQVRERCERIATEMVLGGMKTAACVFPLTTGLDKVKKPFAYGPFRGTISLNAPSQRH
jgi:hypothetical protein